MDLEKVLKSYLADVISVEGLMKYEGLKRDPSQACQKTLYKSGSISASGLKYDFHGMGCLVEWKGREIDFDFRGDANNTIFGINPWFAAGYVKSLKLEGFNEFDYCHEQVLAVVEELVD